MNSEKGRELDRRLREYCAAHTALEVETETERGEDRLRAHLQRARTSTTTSIIAAREMTVPVLDRQSGVPVRVYGVVPKMSLTPGRIWRGAPVVGEDTTDILSKMLWSRTTLRSPGSTTEQVVHRTEPFTEPQVEAIHP